MFIVFIFQRYSVHFVDLGLYPSLSDFKLSSFWDDPSTLWTLVYIRPFWTLNFHPSGMIRPLCGLWLISVRFGPQIFILLGRFVHFMDLLYIRPFWTSNFHPLGMIRPLCGLVVIRPFRTSNFHPLGMIRPLCGPVVIRPFRTSNFHPLGTIRPLCGLVIYPSTLWTLCSLSIHNKNPCGKSKLYLNILL